MADSISSASSTRTLGPTLTLNPYDHLERRQPQQTPSIFTTNPNPTRIPCLQPLQLLGLSLQTACKFIAAILTVEGIFLLAVGVTLLVLEQQKVYYSKSAKVDFKKLKFYEAYKFTGAISTTRGIVYIFQSIGLGVAVSRPYLCACRLWVLLHGTLLASSWIATIAGLIFYTPTSPLIASLLLPLFPSFLEVYSLYIVWSFTKELDAAAFAHRRFQNDAHGRLPVASGSETTELLPVGLEMNVSSQSYQVNGDKGLNQMGKRPGLEGASKEGIKTVSTVGNGSSTATGKENGPPGSANTTGKVNGPPGTGTTTGKVNGPPESGTTTGKVNGPPVGGSITGKINGQPGSGIFAEKANATNGPAGSGNTPATINQPLGNGSATRTINAGGGTGAGRETLPSAGSSSSIEESEDAAAARDRRRKRASRRNLKTRMDRT